MERTERLNFIQKYPIVSFFILALILGAGTIFLVFQGVIPDDLALSSVLSASIAGIIMTSMLDGKAGLKLLLRRLFIWRVGIGYWFFAVLFLVPVILFGSLFNPFFNGNPVSISNLKLSINIFPMFIVFFIVAGLGQELGWTGFIMPRLQARFGALVSSLIRAVLVVIWHLPLLIYSRLQPYAIPDFPYGGWLIKKGFLITFLAMVMLSLPWSILFTWLFNNTKGSLLLVATFHGSEIWLAYLLMGMGINPKNLDNFWGYGMVIILTAIIIVIVTGSQNLSRIHKRIVYKQIRG
jgi:membrane protease YdiL (CAAX protease family)